MLQKHWRARDKRIGVTTTSAEQRATKGLGRDLPTHTAHYRGITDWGLADVADRKFWAANGHQHGGDQFEQEIVGWLTTGTLWVGNPKSKIRSAGRLVVLPGYSFLPGPLSRRRRRKCGNEIERAPAGEVRQLLASTLVASKSLVRDAHCWWRNLVGMIFCASAVCTSRPGL